MEEQVKQQAQPSCLRAGGASRLPLWNSCKALLSSLLPNCPVVPLCVVWALPLKYLGENRSQTLALIRFAERKGACLSNPLVKSASFSPFPHLGEGAGGTSVADTGLKE